MDGVHQSIEVMKSYSLIREDLTNLIELCQYKGSKNPFDEIDAKVIISSTFSFELNLSVIFRLNQLLPGFTIKKVHYYHLLPRLAFQRKK